MRDREKLEAILQIVKDTFPEAELSARGDCVDARKHGPKPPPPVDGNCVAPQLALYFIWTECLVINNGACPDWRFCDRARFTPPV